MNKEQANANSLKEFFKRFPKFYYFVYDFLGPLYFGGLSAKAFLKTYGGNGKSYNLGSGTRRISAEIVNVDTTDYPEVDLVADIMKLPIKDNEAGSIVCEEVLEHVLEPEMAVKEMKRILKPGGSAYVTLPFLYPYHASPDDYHRWTHKGIEDLFKEFEIITIGVRSGPFSMLAVYLCYIFATLLSFGHERLYWFLALAFTFIFFPVKLLDVFGNKLPFSKNMAALLYCVVKKKDEDSQ